MAGTGTDSSQGPFEGSRCVAGPHGRWGSATIRRVNPDGSFKVEFDVKEMAVLPYWYGVTPAEVSFGDALQWTDVFSRISGSGGAFALANFQCALATLGYQIAPDQAQMIWAQSCQTLFNVAGEPAENHVLDETSSYRLFLHLGISAKQCAENLQPDRPKPYFKLYWNQLRMGGREPAEMPRPVTLDDAFAALGLNARRVDHSTAKFLRQGEQEHAIRLPTTLMELLQCDGVARAVMDSHSNNPRLVDFRKDGWNLRRGMRERQLSGDCAIVIMVPHQGDHEWAVVFDDGDEDARVYVRWDAEEGESWLLTAPGVGMFFWDLAQTGLGWYQDQDSKLELGKPARKTDIGLALDGCFECNGSCRCKHCKGTGKRDPRFEPRGPGAPRPIPCAWCRGTGVCHSCQGGERGKE